MAKNKEALVNSLYKLQSGLENAKSHIYAAEVYEELMEFETENPDASVQWEYLNIVLKDIVRQNNGVSGKLGAMSSVYHRIISEEAPEDVNAIIDEVMAALEQCVNNK
jgi:hypothetical protein